MKNLGKIINELDISEIEFEIYQELLKLGPSTVLEISKQTSIPRTTVHQNTEKLLSKGILSQLATSKRRRLIAEPPAVLQKTLEAKKIEIAARSKELRNIEELLPNILSSLQSSIKNEKIPGIEVKYYDQIEQIRSLYDEILQAKEIRTYVNLGDLAGIFPENLNKFALALSKGHKVWDITIGPKDDSDETVLPLKKFDTHFHKHIPNKDTGFYTDYLIYDNSIAIIINDGSVSAVKIKSSALYLNSKFIYDLFWQSIPS